MAKITNEMVQYSYEIAKRIYSNQISFAEGKQEIIFRTGMKEASVISYLYAFLSMMSGEKYTRTINLYATEYFLEHIGTDYGKAAQKRAAEATIKHVQYYKTVRGYLKSFDELAHSYL